MVIYLIRHSMPDAPLDVCYGQSEVGLLQWQFERTIRRLRKQILLNAQVSIYSSPLKRCLKLARAISQKPCSVKIDKRLKELNFGDWEMKRWEDIDDVSLLDWSNDFTYKKIPGGESYNQLYKRVCDFWNELMGEDIEQAVVVTHGGVIKAILAHILEMPVKNSFTFQLHFGETIRIEANDKQPYLVEFTSGWVA